MVLRVFKVKVVFYVVKMGIVDVDVVKEGEEIEEYYWRNDLVVEFSE